MKKTLFIIVLLVINIQLIKAQIGIGTTTPNSSLTVDGSIASNLEIILSDTTLNETHHTVFSNGVTITLPDPTNIIGREYIIKAGTTGTTIVALSGTDVLDGDNVPITLNPFETIKVKALTAGNWLIIKDNNTGAKKINDLSDGKSGGFNYFVGTNAGASVTSGTFNSGFGYETLTSLTTGIANTAFGEETLKNISIGEFNIAIGSSTGSLLTTGDHNILVGNSANANGSGASNELNIGDVIYGTNVYNATGKVGIGNTNNAPNSTLSINGSLSLPQKTGGTYTLTDNDYTYFLNANQEVTLPTAVGIEGRIYIIKRLAFLGNGTVLTTGLETIDGNANLSLNQRYDFIKVQSDGSNWMIIGQN